MRCAERKIHSPIYARRQLQALVRRLARRPASPLARLTSELAAQDRAKQEIVELTRQPLQAEQRGDLRPGTDCVREDMDANPSWGCSQAGIPNGEILRDIRLRVWERLETLPTLGPASSS